MWGAGWQRGGREYRWHEAKESVGWLPGWMAALCVCLGDHTVYARAVYILGYRTCRDEPRRLQNHNLCVPRGCDEGTEA